MLIQNSRSFELGSGSSAGGGGTRSLDVTRSMSKGEEAKQKPTKKMPKLGPSRYQHSHPRFLRRFYES